METPDMEVFYGTTEDGGGYVQLDVIDGELWLTVDRHGVERSTRVHPNQVRQMATNLDDLVGDHSG